MTKILKGKSGYDLKKDLHLYFLSVLLITGLLINVVLLKVYSYREGQVVSEGKKWTIYQTITYVDRIMEEVSSIGEAIWTSSQIQGLKASNLQEIDYLSFLDCMNYLTNMELSINSIYRIRLYYSYTNTLVTSRDGVFYSLDEEAANYYTKWMNQLNNSTWVMDFGDSISHNIRNNPRALYYLRPIYSTGTGKRMGLITIEVLDKTFHELINQKNGLNEGFAIVKDNKLVTHTFQNNEMYGLWADTDGFLDQIRYKQNGSFSFKYNGDKYKCIYETSDESGWKFLSYYKNSFWAFNIIPFIICAILFIVILTAAYTMIMGVSKKKITDPVETLVNAMKKFEEGKFGIQINEKRTDIFGVIYSCFDHMSIRSKELVEELIMERLRLKDGKLKMLQSQIKPHFLYNIFNNMIWMSEQKNYEGLEQMIYSTAGYYKTSLNFGQNFICVADNLKQLQYYAKIQQIRFPNRFTYDIIFEDDILSLFIPNLMLQPLLENSINYSTTGKAGVIHILIHGYKNGDEIIFEVKDNGPGIEPKRLFDIKKAISTEGYQESEFFALANISERLRMYYQGKGSITIDSLYGEWTVVVLKLLEEEVVCIS